MTQCGGPCLEHCYRVNNNKYLYLFLGIIIGILLYYFYKNH